MFGLKSVRKGFGRLSAFPWADAPGELVRSRLRRWAPGAAARYGITCPIGEKGRIPVYSVSDGYFVRVGYEASLPLSLGLIQGYVARHATPELANRIEFQATMGLLPTELMKMAFLKGPGIWLVPVYMWNSPRQQAISKAVKWWDPRNVIVHGGPEVPRQEDVAESYLRQHPYVDVAVRGEGEVTTLEVLDALAFAEDAAGCAERLATVPGITFHPTSRRDGPPIRTPDRGRIMDLDMVPSPYLSGLFDDTHVGRARVAILETNRGCPYACTFCDWGSATNQKMRCFDLDRVLAEIDWIARHRINRLMLADSNFGIFERDVTIAETIARKREEWGTPREVVVLGYAKNSVARLEEIIRIFVDAGIQAEGVISIQTTDPHTLDVIRRSNIKTSKYEELIRVFREKKLPLAAEMMMGLPGSTLESLKSDMQFCFDRDLSLTAYDTRLLVNSPMSDPAYLAAHQIQTDPDNILTSTSTYTRQDRRHMGDLHTTFYAAENLGALRYVLRYLQWDRGIPSLEFLDRLTMALASKPQRFPRFLRLRRPPFRGFRKASQWKELYEEITRFARESFGVEEDSAFACALELNRLTMPSQGRTFPEEHTLRHDFVQYFRDHQAANGSGGPPLSSYEPGTITLSDPLDFCHRSVGTRVRSVSSLELRSVLARTLSRPVKHAPAESLAT